jgi:uncharacterized membrane protein
VGIEQPLEVDAQTVRVGAVDAGLLTTVTQHQQRKRQMLPHDKIIHIAVGFAIFAVACSAMFFLGPAASAPIWVKLFASPTVAMSAARVFAWGKECYDEAHPDVHTRDLFDAEATLTGAHVGLIGYILLVLLTL